MTGPKKRTVLITGCSDGGLGAALAMTFHKAGLHVYATARNPTKMAKIAAAGIETLTLDVLSTSSITACVDQITKATDGAGLDILVNNAGASYNMPIADLDLAEAKTLFDLNVWSYIAVTQAFLPLLVQARGTIVNHTSSASCVALPFQGPYNASKAAMAMFSDTMRFELDPFDVRVVDLKTGIVRSNIMANEKEMGKALPKDSIYAPVRTELEKAMRHEDLQGRGMEAVKWAEGVVSDVLRPKPPTIIWRGEQAWLVRLASVLPHGWLDGTAKKFGGLDVIEKKLKA